MLIIPKDIPFKRATANNVQYGSDRMCFDHQMGGVSCINYGLITSANFNQLSIDLKLVIIDFRISADSQP